jgi:hypothetical protein
MTMMRGGPGNVGLDAMPGDQVPRVAPMLEVGRSGLRRVSGYVNEEFLPQLSGRKAVQVYREMGDNDPIVGALLFAVDRLLRQIEWRVEPAGQSPEDKQNAEFVEQCMEDMSHTWDDLISEILTMIQYGWAFCEVTLKHRVGPWEKSSSNRSKFTDGRLGWRKIALRSQETLQRWVFDDTGGIQAMVQMAPPLYQTTVIPIEKSLLFRTSNAKNNPEGRSLLRTAYRPWYMKKRLEEFEGIGVERDLAGLPMGRVPADSLDAVPGSKQDLMVKAFRKMVRSVRRDEQEGIVLPSMFDENGNQLYEFELLTSGGSRQFDTNAIIQRYEQRILMSVLADFILVGHEESGTYNMHTDKRGLFQTAINSLAQSIAEVFNRYAIPRLFSVNGIKPPELPKIVPNDVNPPDITQLGGFLQQLTSAGMQLFPDPELEKFIRDAARLPEIDPQTEEMKEIQFRQQQVMNIAEQRFSAVQMEQQAQQGDLQTQQQQAAFQADPTGQGQMDPSKDAKAQAITDKGKYEAQNAKLQAAHGQRSGKQDLEFNARQKRQQLQQSEREHKQKLTHAEQLHRLKMQQMKSQAAAKKQPAKKAAPKKGGSSGRSR